MYTVLIVDDERRTRDGLIQHIPWSTLGFSRQLSAPNGAEAIQLLKKETIHAVLTDVIMPELDGIELASFLKEEFPQIPIVFISGHQDVDYLKSALEFSAVDYIFKPIDRNEVKDLFKKIKKKLDDKKKHTDYVNLLRETIKDQLPRLRRRFLRDLIEGRYYRKDHIQRESKNLNIYYPEDTLFTVTIIDFYFSGPQSQESDSLKNIIRQEILEKTLIDEEEHHIFSISPAQFVVLYCYPLSPQIHENRDINLLNKLMQYNQGEVTIGVGNTVESLEEIAASCLQSKSALEKRFFFGRNQVINYRDLPEPSPHLLSRQLKEEAFTFLRTGQDRELSHLLNFIEDDLSSSGMENIESVRLFIIELFFKKEEYLKENGIKDDPESREEALKCIAEGTSIKEIFAVLKSSIVNAIGTIQEKSEHISNKMVHSIIEYMKDNLASEISTQKAADLLQITPNYVSMLFKKNLGLTFSEYIIDLRIKKAKELLADPSLRIYEIADQVGYKDPEYFTRVFRKYSGTSPSQYRENL